MISAQHFSDATGAIAQVAQTHDNRSWYNGLLRWKYILPRAVLVAAVWAIFAYGFDPLMRYGIVTTGERVLGGRVDIDVVQTRFFPPKFEILTVGLTDPDRTNENLVTFDRMLVHLAGEPIMHREFVVERATIEGLRFNADRLTDGALAERELPDGEGFDLKPIQRQLKLLGMQWYDELEAATKKELDPQSLETVQVAQTIESDWTQRLADYEIRIDKLQQQIDAIKEMVDVKGDTLRKLDAYAQASTQVQEILEESQRIRLEVRQLPQIARQDVTRLDEARRRDTVRLKARLTSLPLNPEDISRSLLGPELSERLASINTWVRWTRKYLSEDAVTPNVPPSRGEWILFPRTNVNPTFVLKELAIHGEATRNGEPMAIVAECHGISSDPKLYGVPIDWRFEMGGSEPLAITGNTDLTTEKALHEIAFNWRADHPVNQVVGNEQKLAILLIAESARCDGWLRMDGNRLEGEFHLNQDPMTVEIHESADKFAQRWIAPALRSITTADAKLQLYGTLNDLEWTVQSDIGRQVASGFHQMLVGEVESQRAKLLVRVDAVAREKMEKLPAFVDAQSQYLLADLTSRDSRAKQALARFTDDKFDVQKMSESLKLNGLFKR